MYFSLPCIIHPISLLTLVLALPPPLSSSLFAGIKTQAQNISTINPVTPNARLGHPPGGPSEFTCTVVALSTLAIQPKDMFETVIKMLETITQDDFQGRMPRAVNNFFGPNNLAISVSSVNPRQPIPRRYIMWAITQIMVTMKNQPRVGYHAGVFEPEWQGRKVGTIEICYTRAPNYQLSGDSTSLTLESPKTGQVSTNTTIMVGSDEVSWIYNPGGALMTQWDVAMGTIGALVGAAEHSNHNFDLFQGDFFPAAVAVCVYRATVQPSRLTKVILIRSMAAAAIWALNDGDFHALEVRVMINWQEIAYGGYDQPIPIPPVSTSQSTTAVNSS